MQARGLPSGSGMQPRSLAKPVHRPTERSHLHGERLDRHRGDARTEAARWARLAALGLCSPDQPRPCEARINMRCSSPGQHPDLPQTGRSCWSPRSESPASVGAHPGRRQAPVQGSPAGPAVVTEGCQRIVLERGPRHRSVHLRHARRHVIRRHLRADLPSAGRAYTATGGSCAGTYGRCKQAVPSALNVGA